MFEITIIIFLTLAAFILLGLHSALEQRTEFAPPSQRAGKPSNKQ